MIVLDLINDEAPLISAAVEKLINTKKIAKKEVLGVLEGSRWNKEMKDLNSVNRLHFFEELDQKQINISEELTRIAKEYDGFNIYACDRYLIKKPVVFQKKMLVYSFLFFETIFKKNVTHYFTTGIAYTYNLISYEVSKKYAVKHISFYSIRFENKTAISYDLINTFDEVATLYKEFNEKKVTPKMKEVVNNFVNKPVQPAYMTNAANSFSLEPVFVKEFFIRFKWYYLANKHKYDMFTRNPFELSFIKINKIVNAKKLNLFYKKLFDKVDYTEKYFLFPLHMQPEASTLILAPFNVNQQETIINISKALPVDTYLYVKEHKSAFGQHQVSFYKELRKYPKIKLISYTENTFELIKNAKGVINLSSTVGFEALLYKIPVILLGDVYYENTQLTFKVNSYKAIKETVNLILKDDFSLDNYFTNYDAKIAYYIHCLLKASYPFEFNVAKLDTKKIVMQKENIEEFAKCIDKVVS